LSVALSVHAVSGVLISQDGSVCGTAASASGFGNRFIHIEQDVPALGADLSGVSSAWAQAVVAALPAALPVPAAPTGLTAAPGPAQISLSWSASNGASSYKVKRSTSASGTYTVIATGLPGTRFTDTGLKSGKIYYYYVNATNASGTSANSNQASAQAR
jgi:cellulose 1,4-beta-cellobiosidase